MLRNRPTRLQFVKEVVVAAWLLIATATGQSQVLPTGFVSETVVQGFDRPCALAQLPDQRLLVAEHWTGNIHVVVNGARHLVGSVAGLATGFSEGLLGLAVDPAWPTRPHLYLWHCQQSPATTRLSMWSLTGSLSGPSSANLQVSSRRTLLDIPNTNIMHNGGCLRFGPDGMLYLSTGDDTQCCHAQDPSSPLGKILRLDVRNLSPQSALPPLISELQAPGNPFAMGSGHAPLVWCLGLRNPFRMHFNQRSGQLLVTDVGETGFEEVHVAENGGENFGWPHYEGPASLQTAIGTCAGVLATSCGLPPMTHSEPVHVESHANGAASMIGMGFVPASQGAAWGFGADYEDDYFFADHYNGRMRRLRFDGSAWFVPPPVPGQLYPSTDIWGHRVYRVSDAIFAADGALYWLEYPSFGTGRLNRIRPAARSLSIVAGNGQRGNAATTLSTPLTIELHDAQGRPAPGVPVRFEMLVGAGSPSDDTRVTDQNGRAQLAFIPGLPAQEIRIQASAPGAAPVVFTITGRGLELDRSLPGHAMLKLVHSESDSPLTFVVDFAPASPHSVWPEGAVWTAILNPHPGLFVLDGLGALGPPILSLRTGTLQPTWEQTFATPVLGGIDLVAQAYAVDRSVLGQPDAILVSNPVFMTL